MLSVIIPVYNRLENLKLCLASLAQQINPPDFEVIVVDDGSTDGLTGDWVADLNFDGMSGGKSTAWNWLGYLSGGPNKGFRGGRARNIGAFNANGDRYIFVDSDVVLNENALAAYAKASEAQPDCIIVGQYHWLPPVDWFEPELLWKAPSFDSLMQTVMSRQLLLSIPNDSPFGPDIRSADFTDDLTAIRKGSGLGALSGNISYPKNLFWQLGGFDERIVGHGGEDADLGLTADEAGTDWLFYKSIFGFHVWHPRDQKANSREVQANITFIDAKHGVGKYANAKKWTDSQDWSDPIHYHKHLSASLLKIGFDPQVYAYRENHYIKLSDPKWLIELGFKWDDVELVEPEFFADKIYSGDTQPLGPIVVQQVVSEPEVKLEPVVGDVPVIDDKAKHPSYYKKSNAGSILLREEHSETVFAVRNDYRMGINHPEWIIWLQFTPDQITVVADGYLKKFFEVGQTPDVNQIYTGEINRG